MLVLFNLEALFVILHFFSNNIAAHYSSKTFI